MSKEVIIDIENPKDNDLISRQAVKEIFPKWKFISYEAYLCSVLEIDKLPSVSTEKTGHWVHKGQGIYCSECGKESGYNPFGASRFSDYCPNCGCRMVEPQESEE